ncbi:MAG: tRNA (adenosine(37)-N6)-threonylcarbamoyltransferase complex ATPase subunit type 1 TsaE [Cytophagaceae bacterium]|jgi:tRNA threonylcarbamoyladenosine biosynthesis protein TsaE|nr:tRNA (adenosine(37)-N6)-threonylcarbamoyltransferase complex ATPase subunit type 1 TsaE [Cytophagaceae bacterium]
MNLIRIEKINALPEAAKKFIQLMGDHTVFAFDGKMGAGKTTFIKVVCEALGVTDTINSPTFAIVNEYQSQLTGKLIYHFDFYRIQNIQEALQIGVEDYFDSNALCFIEWADKIKVLLPEDAVFIHFEVQSGGERILEIR